MQTLVDSSIITSTNSMSFEHKSLGNPRNTIDSPRIRPGTFEFIQDPNNAKLIAALVEERLRTGRVDHFEVLYRLPVAAE